MMNRLKKKSKKLRTLLAQQFGTEVDHLSTVLGNEDQKKHFKPNSDDKDDDSEPIKLYSSEGDNPGKLGDSESNLNENERKTYTDSSTFLKGTQSANPHNDYCQHFVDTGKRVGEKESVHRAVSTNQMI